MDMACCFFLSEYVYEACLVMSILTCFFFFQAEDGIRDDLVTGVQTCALPISRALTFEWSSVSARAQAQQREVRSAKHLPAATGSAAIASITAARYGHECAWCRSEERRVGKSVDLGGRRIIKKKKREE